MVPWAEVGGTNSLRKKWGKSTKLEKKPRMDANGRKWE